jgi:hypothetical protein
MRKVVDIHSSTNCLIPELEYLPVVGEKLTLRLKPGNNQILILTALIDQVYIVITEDYATHHLVLTDCSLPKPGFLLRGTVKSVTFLSYLELPKHAKLARRLDSNFQVQLLKPGEKPVTQKADYYNCFKQEKPTNWSGFSNSWYKPEDNTTELTTLRKEFVKRQSQLQQIKCLLENKAVMFLDVDNLESLIDKLDDSELNHLCSGRVFK